MAVSLTLTPRDACRVGTCAVKCQASHKAPSHGPFQAPRSCSLRGARRTSANLETNCTWPAHYGSATPLFPQSPSSRQAISRCPAAARAGKSRPWTRPHGGPGSKRRGEGNHSFSNPLSHKRNGRGLSFSWLTWWPHCACNHTMVVSSGGARKVRGRRRAS